MHLSIVLLRESIKHGEEKIARWSARCATVPPWPLTKNPGLVASSGTVLFFWGGYIFLSYLSHKPADPNLFSLPAGWGL